MKNYFKKLQGEHEHLLRTTPHVKTSGNEPELWEAEVNYCHHLHRNHHNHYNNNHHQDHHHDHHQDHHHDHH